MKKEQIQELFSRFEAAVAEVEGIECWSARDMQTLLGYAKWENFEKVIQKAKDSCKTAGEDVFDHFPDVRKTIAMPNLSSAEDLKKLQRKLESDEKNILKTTKKKKRK